MSDIKQHVSKIDLITAANALFAHGNISTCESEAMKLCVMAKAHYQGVAKWDDIECGKSPNDFCELGVDVLIKDQVFEFLGLSSDL